MMLSTGRRLEIWVDSQRYNQESVQAILDRLDGPTFLRDLGMTNGDFVKDETELRSYCPLCHDRSKMTFILDLTSKRAYCTNLSCQASNMNSGGANLLQLYALATGGDFDHAAEHFATEMNVPLVRDKAAEERLGPVAGDFQYVEVGHLVRAEGEAELQPVLISIAGQQGYGRGIVIPQAQVDEFVVKYKSDVYCSQFLYNMAGKTEIDQAAEQGKLFLLGDFYVVFHASSSAEIVHAINQAIELVEQLKETYDIPYEAINVFYTNRNITVQADYSVFGISPTANLHEIYRRMACAIVGVDPLKPERSPSFSQIDLDVYRHDYLTNVAGTPVSAGAREIYKIRMSYAAFKKMSYQRLHEFSLRRPDLPPRERWLQVSQKAREFFGSVRTSLVRDASLDESDKIASLFYRVSEKRADIASLKELAPTLLRRLFDESRQVLVTPSAHLNRALAGGLYPGQLYVVAGFPGSGTSSFALQLMNHVAAEQGVQCLFVGLQRGVEEVFKRSLSSLGRISVGEIDKKRQSPNELYEDKDFNRRIFAAYESYQKFADNIIILEGAAACNMARLAQLIHDRKEELKAQTARTANMLLVIDSLQLMVAMMRAMWAEGALGGEGTSRQMAQWDVDTLTSRLKALARELDITVLATFEQYVVHRAMASELSENDPAVRSLLYSTQFADSVMVLLRQGATLLNLRDHFKTHLTGTPQEAQFSQVAERLRTFEERYKLTEEFQSQSSEFIVADIIKNRSGPRDKVLFVYHKSTSFFKPLDYVLAS